MVRLFSHKTLGDASLFNGRGWCFVFVFFYIITFLDFVVEF